MRRFANGLLVLTVVLSLTTTTAFAASRRNDGDYQNPIQKIVQLVKKVVRTLDTIDMTYPKP